MLLRVISDDYLNTHFKKNIKSQHKNFIFFDCCIGGTQMDLRYQYKDKSWVKVNNNNCLVKYYLCADVKMNQDSQEMYNINNDKIGLSYDYIVCKLYKK